MHFCFDLISKDSAQDLSARGFGNNVREDDAAVQFLVWGYSLLHPLVDILLLNFISSLGGIEYNVCSGEFTGFVIRHRDHGSIADSLVSE